MPADESSAASTGRGPASADVGALIDLILERFHAAHRRVGPELSRAAERLEAEHADDASWPKGLAALIERINGRLAAHMAKEEIVVFPRMRLAGALRSIGRLRFCMPSMRISNGTWTRSGR
jgi:iron-sulfur cluster repair protein YtfE (RIC family)